MVLLVFVLKYNTQSYSLVPNSSALKGQSVKFVSTWTHRTI